MMRACEEEYSALVTEVFLKYDVMLPVVETYSTHVGGIFRGPFTADYFWESSVGPVRFTHAMQALVATHPHAIYLEVGPHPVLSSYISALAGKDNTITCTLRRPRKTEQAVEVSTFLESIGRLVVSGYNFVDFDILYGGSARSEPPLIYHFAKKRIPYAAPSLVTARRQQHRRGPLNYPQLQINTKTHPDLADHVIKDEPIMPAAGYLEMV